jgi:hypothetical protein
MATFMIIDSNIALFIVELIRNLTKSHYRNEIHEIIHQYLPMRSLYNSIPPSIHDESPQSHDLHL